jgi:hypothetical protein
MNQKNFLLALGERKEGAQADTDILLTESITERKRRQIERQEELDTAAHEARMADLKKKVITSEASVEKAFQAPTEKSPLSVKGEFNLGSYDIQAMQEDARRRTEEAQRQAEEARMAAEERARKAEERAHETELQALQNLFNTQINELKSHIESGMSKGSFLQQYNEVMETAKALGASIGPAQGVNPAANLDTLKFQHQMAMEDREFQRKMKESDRQWDMKMAELQEERSLKREELALRRNQYEMLSNAPRMIGEAIGTALLGGTQTTDAISKKPRTTQAPSAQSNKAFHIEASPGEIGEAQCPNCGGTIAIGPETSEASCVKCGQKAIVTRVGATSPANIDDYEEEE